MCVKAEMTGKQKNLNLRAREALRCHWRNKTHIDELLLNLEYLCFFSKKNVGNTE